MNSHIKVSEGYKRLQNLSADEAIVCFLQGGFKFGEESALCDAIKNGLTLPMTKDGIEFILAECLEHDVSAEDCKSYLISGTRK